METIKIGEVRNRFSELITRVIAGERVMIQRREKPVAVLISTGELERLERASRAAHRMALAMGQDPELLEKIETKAAHPAMAAFGLWKDEPDLATLAQEIQEERQKTSSRPDISL
mgnify:CR=1 FL=1